MNIKEKLLNHHNKIFGKPEIVVASPGRANIIGEHTDYNQGLVLPYALNKHIYMSASRSPEPYFHVYSADQKRYVDFSIKEGRPSWARYFDQVITFIEDHFGKVPGLEITMLSDLPIGAGVSSSSALTCGVIYLINEYMDLNLSTEKMIQIATFTEHGVGLQGGTMDQSTILKATKDCAILMDFGNNKEEYIPLIMDGYDFYLVYSDISHSLVDSEYNIRRKECDKATDIISNNYKKIDHISQLNIVDIDQLDLPQPLFKRVSFVIEENQRVRDVAFKLKEGKIAEIGSLINDSHQGLTDKYEVSTEQVDWLVERLQNQTHIEGARMIGGGFGGSILVLLKDEYKGEIETVVSEYNRKFDKKGYWFNAHSGEPLRRIDIN